MVCIRILCLSFLSLATATGSVFTTGSRQTTFAVVCTNGVAPGFCAGGTTSQVDDSQVNGVSHSNNFDGNLNTASEARTAGRSGPNEIAANATIRHRNGGPFQDYTDVYGDALYEWDLLVLNEGNVTFHFALPPGFVEIESNAEFRDLVTLHAAVQVDIQFCSPACTYSAANTSLFQFYSTLEGGFDTYTLTNNAVSVNPALDTSALTHQNVTLTDGGFIRTYTWDFDTFTGTIPLGHFAGGQTFSVAYRMRGEVYSEFGAFQTWAGAAINDPFFLSTDVLPQQSIGSFAFEPSGGVPEPASMALFGAGLGVLWILRSGNHGAR